MSDKEIEEIIQAKGLTAARVTPDDVEAVIVGEIYIVPNDSNIYQDGAHASGEFDEQKIKQTTICMLTLMNGFTVTGINNGPVSGANFDGELARKLAREKAVDQIWPLLGYQLKERLWAQSQVPKINT